MAATLKSVLFYNARDLARDYYLEANLTNPFPQWHSSSNTSFTTAIILTVFALLGILLAAAALLKAFTQLSLRPYNRALTYHDCRYLFVLFLLFAFVLSVGPWFAVSMKKGANDVDCRTQWCLWMTVLGALICAQFCEVVCAFDNYCMMHTAKTRRTIVGVLIIIVVVIIVAIIVSIVVALIVAAAAGGGARGGISNWGRHHHSSCGGTWFFVPWFWYWGYSSPERARYYQAQATPTQQQKQDITNRLASPARMDEGRDVPPQGWKHAATFFIIALCFSLPWLVLWEATLSYGPTMWRNLNIPYETVRLLPDALTITYLWRSYGQEAFMGTSVAHLWSITAFVLSLLHITFLVLICWKKHTRQNVLGEQAPDVFERGDNPEPDNTMPPPPYEARQAPKIVLLVAEMLLHIVTFFAPVLTYSIYVWGEFALNQTVIDVMLCMVVGGQVIHAVLYVFRLFTYQPSSK